MPNREFIPAKFKPWIEARKRYGLSHAQVQMARELGINPKKLGGMANHEQQQWKLPLPEFLQHAYEQRFGRARPHDVRSIEERVFEKRSRKKAAGDSKNET